MKDPHNLLLPPDHEQPGPPSPSRRSFLISAALGSGALLLTGVPLASYVAAPAFHKSAGKWVDFGPLEDLDSGRVHMLTYDFMVRDGWLVLPQRGFVWAQRETGDTVRVFSSTCTHLACNVIWQEKEGVFQCPCHSGRFDADGQPIAGPPTRPLRNLQQKIEDGTLFVFLST